MKVEVSKKDVKDAIERLKKIGVEVKRKRGTNEKYEIIINDRSVVIRNDVDLVALANMLVDVKALDKSNQ